MAKKKREKPVVTAKKTEKRKYTKKPKEATVIFKKEDVKPEKVEKAKPEPKATDKVLCECGKPAEENSHQCFDCAHRS